MSDLSKLLLSEEAAKVVAVSHCVQMNHGAPCCLDQPGSTCGYPHEQLAAATIALEDLWEWLSSKGVR